MANLKEIRSRISSISSTMQITSAMKMVSASKLRRAQDAIMVMRPYAEKLSQLVSSLSTALGKDDKFKRQAEVKNKVLLVAITSNKGLAGAFNSNIVKKVTDLASEEYKDAEVDVYAIGKKGRDLLKKKFHLLASDIEVTEDLTFARASAIAEKLIEVFLSSESGYDEIVLVYNSFKNAATQVVKADVFLPLHIEESESVNEVDYIFEPTKEEIIQELIPRSLKLQVFKVLRDSVASEHGARMTAMHKATDNGEQLMSELKLTYNKARQASITGEIIEIVGGAEALN